VRRTERHWFVGTADAVAMHGAVQVHAGNAVAMWLEDAFHYGFLVYASRTFVVDDEVEAFRVVRVTVDSKVRFGRLVIGMDLGDFGVKTFFESFFEDVLLLGVIMAAAAGDEQNSEGFGSVCVTGQRSEQAEAQQEGGN